MYDELIKSLRLCASDKRGYGCAKECAYGKKYPLNWWCMNYLLKEAADAIEELAAGVVKRKQSKWIKTHDNICYWYECSVCGERPLNSIWTDEEVKSNYCPNCGARMVESQ